MSGSRHTTESATDTSAQANCARLHWLRFLLEPRRTTGTATRPRLRRRGMGRRDCIDIDGSVHPASRPRCDPTRMTPLANVGETG
jgi:hypothetical protein